MSEVSLYGNEVRRMRHLGGAAGQKGDAHISPATWKPNHSQNIMFQATSIGSGLGHIRARWRVFGNDSFFEGNNSFFLEIDSFPRCRA